MCKDEVEKLLKTQDKPDQDKDGKSNASSSYVESTLNIISQGLPDGGNFLGSADPVSSNFTESISPRPEAFSAANPGSANSANNDFPWEMIGLGLDEPLPPQDVINEL